ncbi:Ankyrin repeat and LEM domain-containing protein 2 [Fasciolopsis buskii]|uniref:Ankyrin repeat and LEM domain-containing protein 2 n=1 Tax=Fasciolopsis buskii TaxID=27845 RepID=A0A8E0RJT0_9TREM|nr:Ankyrin repeat and LEM domain-containing protein 2 [Fasciolopsis buski]
MDSKSDSDEEFYDCLSNVKYCAIASPQGKGCGEVFLDVKKAYGKWKQTKGARMKVFEDYHCAQEFANTPVKNKIEPIIYPASPKADVESTPYSSVTQPSLLKFRALIEKCDIDGMRQMVDQNPMTLVTSSDTPTLIQVRLRYNALHVASAAGVADAVDFLLSRLNSTSLWKQIYPDTDDQTAIERQRRVTDLYLNSPELGNLETPLHFACKFGHLSCARLLVYHPLTQLNALNRSGQNAVALACSRMSNGAQIESHEGADPTSRTAVILQSLRRLFDEFFVVLADVQSNALTDKKITVLGPCSSQRLQTVLTLLCDRPYSGLISLFPYLSAAFVFNQNPGFRLSPVEDQHHAAEFADLGLRNSFSFLGIRAIAGPMPRKEAEAFKAKWLKANSTFTHGAFASIRLTDPEKGYERQGRYFSRLFGTQWLEYWDFLDDFADLSSVKGLELLDQYMDTDNSLLRLPCQLLSKKSRRSQWDRSKRHKASSNSVRPNVSETATSAPAELRLGEDSVAPPTPVSRVRRSSQLTTSTGDNWHAHRSFQTGSKLLNDSLDESSDNSELQTSSHESDLTMEDTVSTLPVCRSFSPLSPIVGLLEKLTFRSPLRWLLVDRPGFGEPLFNPQDLETPFASQSTRHTERASSNLGNSVGSNKSHPKRRMSAANLNQSANDSEQPVVKKPSPGASHAALLEPLAKEVLLPPLFRHVCRSLPGGDPELETAVAVLACADKKAKATSDSSTVDCLAPRWFRPISLSKYHNVSNWKRFVEECDAHLSHCKN